MRSEFSLAKATLLAFGVAAVLLVTVVMPAEYGTDWTGVGRLLGLTAMGQQKMAAEKLQGAAVDSKGLAAPAQPARHASTAARPLRADAVDIALPPKAEVEYKAVLAEGDAIVYEWKANGAGVIFDFHGEPSSGPQGAFLTFEKGQGSQKAGALTAPFAGTHGWYWRNPGAEPVVIRLTVSGFHSELKKM